MTDRELLELAAKAAGITFHAELEGWAHQDWCRYFADGEFCTCGGAWNPLTDDGDALRLAVKLGLFAYPNFEIHHCGTDDYEGMRRAIVRAAAELARPSPALPQQAEGEK